MISERSINISSDQNLAKRNRDTRRKDISMSLFHSSFTKKKNCFINCNFRRSQKQHRVDFNACA